MITNLHSDNLTCPKCGGLRFRIEEDFELKPLTSSRYDDLYDAVGRRTRFICSSCGEVVKEFDKELVKINMHD